MSNVITVTRRPSPLSPRPATSRPTHMTTRLSYTAGPNPSPDTLAGDYRRNRAGERLLPGLHTHTVTCVAKLKALECRWSKKYAGWWVPDGNFARAKTVLHNAEMNLAAPAKQTRRGNPKWSGYGD